MPEGWSGQNTAAPVIVHPSGRFAYASNRGHRSVAAFAIQATTGGVELLGHTATRGQVRRDTRLDLAGAFRLVANQDSDVVVVFQVDRATGALRQTGRSARVLNPVRVLFAPE